MPTYEYECTKCGHEFELFQGINEEPRKRCPRCRSKVRRKIGTGGGLLFKGSGFYITDYRSDNYQKAAKADSTSPTKGSKADPPKPKAKSESAAKIT
jgi:putative FmdB family regulatory protein